MSMIEQYPARPECVYGTREFNEKRKARMAAMRKPVRRAATDVAEPAPFTCLRGAAAHYDSIRERLFPRVVHISSREPDPAPETAPETAVEQQPDPMVSIWRDWLVISSPVRVKHILAAAAEHYGVSVDDIISPRRTANVMMPRQVAMYLAKTLTLRSLPDIGMRFGGRDHTTILHGVRKIEALIATSPKLADDIATITRRIHARAAA